MYRSEIFLLLILDLVFQGATEIKIKVVLKKKSLTLLDCFNLHKIRCSSSSNYLTALRNFPTNFRKLSKFSAATSETFSEEKAKAVLLNEEWWQQPSEQIVFVHSYVVFSRSSVIFVALQWTLSNLSTLLEIWYPKQKAVLSPNECSQMLKEVKESFPVTCNLC